MKEPLFFYGDTSRPDFATGFTISGVESLDNGALPRPPATVMQYGEDQRTHLRNGRRLARMVRSTLAEHGTDLTTLPRVLEFGCGNSRVLRHFADEATLDGAEYWGCDIDSRLVHWSMGAMSPPFNYFVNTTTPHLPMADGYFDFIYAMSIFTHIEEMFFAWLLELRRVMAPGGLAFVTFLTEASVQFGLDNPGRPIGATVDANSELVDALITGTSNMVVIKRPGWRSTTFVRREFLTHWLSQAFDIENVLDATVAKHQTGYLLRNTRR